MPAKCLPPTECETSPPLRHFRDCASLVTGKDNVAFTSRLAGAYRFDSENKKENTCAWRTDRDGLVRRASLHRESDFGDTPAQCLGIG